MFPDAVWLGPERNQNVPPEGWIAETCDCIMNQGWVVLWWIAVFLFFYFICLSFLLVVPHPFRGSETWSFEMLSILFQTKDPTPSQPRPSNQMFTPMAIRCLTCSHPISIPVMTLNQIIAQEIRLLMFFFCPVYIQWFDDSGQGCQVFSVYADCSDCPFFQCSISLLFKFYLKLKISSSDTSEGGHQQTDVHI